MSTDTDETRTDQGAGYEEDWAREDVGAAQEAAMAEEARRSEDGEAEPVVEGDDEAARGEQDEQDVDGDRTVQAGEPERLDEPVAETDEPAELDEADQPVETDEFPAYGELTQNADSVDSVDSVDPADSPEAEGTGTVSEPEVFAAESEGFATEPEGAEDVSEPEGAVYEPESAVLEPEGAVSEPEVVAAEPEGVAKPEDLGGRDIGAEGEPLVSAEAKQEFLDRWTRVQVSFVEDPATAVESAGTLIQEISAAIVTALDERADELAAGGRAASDTEQLRLALRQYRAFIGVALPK